MQKKMNSATVCHLNYSSSNKTRLHFFFRLILLDVTYKKNVPCI